MSTPFPLEEADQTERAQPTWDPWKQAAPTSFLSDVVRSPYTVLEGLGAGAAKGEAVLGGLVNFAGNVYNSVGIPRAVGKEIAPIGTDIQADARERLKALTPDAATTGTATRVLHSVSSGVEEFALGSLTGIPGGGALGVGSSEGTARYEELREQGVDSTTAAESGALTGVTSAAGVLLPAAYGSSLLARLATGAASNVALGGLDRYGDHLILAANGYPEMADQQKTFDLSQILVDAALGATFGGLHHLADSAKTDAALTMNLASRDRRSAPGVATDPRSANAHQAALEKGTEDLLQGNPVDVSDTGIDRSTFLERPTPNISEPQRILINSFKDAGYFDVDADIRSLEKALRERGREVETEAENVPRGTSAESPDVLDEPLKERPDMQIPDENGKVGRADEALEAANPEENMGKAIDAAVGCFARRGA